uniref:Uncharacterized protein n=1 Tax=Anguilla anguilla TaxID=7936 RepID=A0A0E9SD97_ANGAN
MIRPQRFPKIQHICGVSGHPLVRNLLELRN